MTLEANVHDSKHVEIERLAAARLGDEHAFGELTLPLQRELHVHCYRMLGSLDDADDALQETYLRAWQGLDRFEPRAPLRAWLYRIATNVCLTLLKRRVQRREMAATELQDSRGELRGKEGEPMWLEPYPDRLLDGHAPIVAGPEVAAERHERVELAFIAAVQLLPPRQRAALLLRDVVGYSAAEVAPMLVTSVAGVNSALQRARATLQQERSAGRVTRGHSHTNTANERALVRRLTAAWHAADVTSLVALLTEDALLTMPPRPDRYVGRDAIRAFLTALPEGRRLDWYRLVPTRANRQPALAAYYRDGEAGAYTGHAVIVLAIEGDAIASLVRFGGPDLFARFGLPTSLDGSAGAALSEGTI